MQAEIEGLSVRHGSLYVYAAAFRAFEDSSYCCWL